MTWFGWLLIAWYIANILITVWLVGRPRKPLEPGGAAVAVSIFGLLIWGLFTVGTGSL